MHPVALLSLILGILVSASLASGTFENVQVDRVIDLTSQFARHSVNVTAKNIGSGSASEYSIAVPAQSAGHLSYVEARTADSAAVLTTKAESKDGNQLYTVQLASPVAGQATVDLQLKFVYTHAMTPFPAAIKQGERQLVRYQDNHFFYSPYATKSQKTEVKLASASVESKSEQAPTSQKGNTITYGPYEDIPALSNSAMSIHFENNKVFLTVTKMEKLIEVSHWGNVAIEEDVKMQNDGAELKGTFSRYDYQRSRGFSPAHIDQMVEILPEGAVDVYYRDEIGNISTSHVSNTDRGVTLELTPRFPLFGGWKFGFYIGYNLPIQSYLSTDNEDSSKFVLNVPFSSNLQDAVVDELTVRVILPEGAKNAKAHIPFAVDGESTDVHFTYLDTSGRPVLIINKKNVSPEHNQYFQVTYTFSKFSMFSEPLLLVIAFFLFFSLFMFYTRLEFNIGVQTKQRSDVADKVDEALLRFRGIMEQRAFHHQALDTALNKTLSSRNPQQYQTDKQRPETSLNTCKREMTKLIVQVEELSGDVARKIKSAEALEEKKITNQVQLHELEIAYMKNPKLKSTYDASRGKYESAYNAADEEIESLVIDLTENL